MCAANMLLGLAGAALGLGALATTNKSKVTMPEITTTNAPDAPEPTQGVEAPQATPVMSTQGQEQAEDEQKATEQRVRKNRQGRNILRIDRTVPNNSGLAGGSGVNVPGG